jgi:type IV secretion system protein TrbG
MKQHTRLIVAFMLLCLAAAVAQQAPTPAVPKALPPPAAYESVLHILGASDDASAQPGAAIAPTAPAAANKSNPGWRKVGSEEPIADELPLQLSRETPLPANAVAALAMSRASLDADPQAQQAADGRVIYTFGKGTPPIVCALLQVTEIDLEPGETVAKEGVDLGDRTEFEEVVRRGGSGAEAFDYLVVKPKVAGVETTMTVGTDRRVYYFRLRSTEREYLSRVAFTYPAEEAARKKAQEEEDASRAKAAAQAAAKLAVLAPPLTVTSWKYTLATHGRDAQYLVPVSVGDDGVHTHIRLSQLARTHGLPVLQIRDASGPIPANSHWEQNTLIVDAIFENGCLLEGVGRKQQRVCIHNDGVGNGSHGK